MKHLVKQTFRYYCKVSLGKKNIHFFIDSWRAPLVRPAPQQTLSTVSTQTDNHPTTAFEQLKWRVEDTRFGEVLRAPDGHTLLPPIYNEVAQGTAKRLNDLVTEAIAKKYQIVLIIDDYTAIHNIRRPTTIQSCNPKSTCTILVKLFRNILAIPACPATNYHSLKALDIPAVVNSVSGPAAMYKLSQSYSSMMPSWIRNCFFNPELERHRLSSHQYCQHDSVRTMRQMQDVHLVDFVELNLKSNDDFDAAFDIVLSTNLLEYLKHFLRSQPGDWPAQFYSRQIIYETL